MTPRASRAPPIGMSRHFPAVLPHARTYMKIRKIARRVKVSGQGLVRGDSMKARAIRGSGWTAAESVTSLGIRLVSSLILTRLLFPEAYGLMALAQVFLSALTMLSDLGLQPAIIQSKRGFQANYLNTAWTLQIARGSLLWMLACAVAYPASVVYDEPQLLGVLCILGATSFISGFNTMSLATANKGIRLGRLCLINVGCQIASTAIMILWAWLHPSVWALVAGAIAGSALKLVIAFLMLPDHGHRIALDRSAARELLAFGVWIFLSSTLGFAANNTDRFLIAEFLGTEELGLYAIAVNIASIPFLLNQKLSDRVVFAALAEIRDDEREAFRTKLSRVRRWKTALLLPPACALIIFGTEIIALLYDPRYEQAGWMLQVLAAGLAWPIAAGVAGPYLLSRGRSALFALFMLTRFSVSAGSMVAFAAAMGPTGIVVGFAAGKVLHYPFEVLFIRRHGIWLWKLDASFAAIITTAVAIALWRAAS